MANDFSFDVVSKVEPTLVDEAVSTAMKEVVNRYDFRNTGSEITYDRKASAITMESLTTQPL